MPPFDRHGGDKDVQDELDVPEVKNKMKARNYSQESVDNWLKLDNTMKKASRIWVHKYAKEPENATVWQILAEEKQIITFSMEEQAMDAQRLSKEHEKLSAKVNPPASTLDATGEDTCGEDESDVGAAQSTASSVEKELIYLSAMSSAKERPAAPSDPTKMPHTYVPKVARSGATMANNPRPLNLDPVPKKLPWDVNPAKVNWNKMFFDYFVPSHAGKAEIADRIH